MSKYKDFYNKEVEWINSSVKGLKGKPLTTFNTSDTSSIVEPIRVTGNGQFSVCNKKVLTDLIKSKPHASLFVEIGTASTYTASSTETIINNKTENCLFYTIDIDERVLSVEGLHRNISIIQSDSTGDKVKELLQGKRIDILFIDGDHSIDRVFAEYEFYLPYMKDDGIIVLHDTTMHPGPLLLMEAIDTNVFKTEIFCSDDYGIGVIYLK